MGLGLVGRKGQYLSRSAVRRLSTGGSAVGIWAVARLVPCPPAVTAEIADKLLLPRYLLRGPFRFAALPLYAGLLSWSGLA